MIYDDIYNIDAYRNLSKDIFAGLQFIQHADVNVEEGVYPVNERARAIVSKYDTLQQNPHGYEAHRQYIDIQYLAKGEEIIKVAPVLQMVEVKPYDARTDYALYGLGKHTSHTCDLLVSHGFFCILFPRDAHMPQLCVKEPEKVTKIVVKVEMPGGV